MKKLLKLISVAITSFVGLIVAFILFIFFSFSYGCVKTRFFPDVNPKECPINTIIDFRNITQCKHRVWGGWLDAPTLVKARGEFPNCNNFLSNETSKVESRKPSYTDSSDNNCFSSDPSAFKTIPCQDVAMPNRYRCFVCDDYPYKTVYGFGSNCSDSVIYNARGLNLEYLSKKIPLEFESLN